MPAKEYICIQYEPIFAFDDMIKNFQDCSDDTDENDFVECLAYSKEHSVLMKGKMVDSAESSKVSYFNTFEELSEVCRWSKQ